MYGRLDCTLQFFPIHLVCFQLLLISQSGTSLFLHWNILRKTLGRPLVWIKLYFEPQKWHNPLLNRDNSRFQWITLSNSTSLSQGWYHSHSNRKRRPKRLRLEFFRSAFAAPSSSALTSSNHPKLALHYGVKNYPQLNCIILLYVNRSIWLW